MSQEYVFGSVGANVTCRERAFGLFEIDDIFMNTSIGLTTIFNMFNHFLSTLCACLAVTPVLGANNGSIAHSASSLPFRISPKTVEKDKSYVAPVYPILPFNKFAGNPILTPNPKVNFESAFLFNPTAIVLNETIFLLYRAQNSSKTSSIGLAWSTDGTNFTRLDRPIIYATEPWEHIGGTEGE